MKIEHIKDFKALEKFAGPLVKNHWSSLAINEIVSVQPMTQPSGIHFFYDDKYQKREKYHVNTPIEAIGLTIDEQIDVIMQRMGY